MLELAEHYNDRLLKLYGREQLTDKQRYRLVWGPSQTEKRYGSYDVLTHETGIWLGVKQGLVEIKKYWYIKDCWILERVEPNLDRKDTFYDSFTYEPILTFLDKDNNILPLNWRAIELAVNIIEKGPKKVLTEEDHFKEEEKKDQAEYEKVYGILDKPDPIKPLPTFNSSTLITR
jgi:hypothetical protein